jgi:hypothetical protein
VVRGHARLASVRARPPASAFSIGKDHWERASRDTLAATEARRCNCFPKDQRKKAQKGDGVRDLLESTRKQPNQSKPMMMFEKRFLGGKTSLVGLSATPHKSYTAK